MDRRPVHLNLLVIRFPITAWVSVLHRISGLVVFLLIPFFLWMLQESLASEKRLSALKVFLNGTWLKVILSVLLASILYHTIAGIRHLLMDVHLGESKGQGVVTSWITFLIFFASSGAIGYWLW